MKPIDIDMEAEDELLSAIDYYETKSPGMGSKFRVEYEAGIAKIISNPEMYSDEGDGLRICPLVKFPYSIYFRDLPDHIWIAAIAHHKRRPRYWSGKPE